MGRGKLSEETIKKRKFEALQKWAKDQGIELPELKEPDETPSEMMREAQSVIYYFETGGLGFKEKQCKNCKRVFKYKWKYDSISFCSIQCIAADLERIGITWDPSKPPESRWGRHAPAVVPPQALSLLEDLDDSQED